MADRPSAAPTLAYAILRAASLLAPAEQRAEWLRGWNSELFYIPAHTASRFCLGAFRDALYLRRNRVSIAKSSAGFESPLRCLLFLAVVAVVSGVVLTRLPAPDVTGMLLLFAPTLLPACSTTGWGASRQFPTPWPSKLRRAIFLWMKLALVQPTMLCGCAVIMWAGPKGALPMQLANYTLWFLTLRWVLLDQRNRCPVCLRLLTEPVRIGAPSQTFLEWYGSESACPCGHGLLQTSECSGSSEWHRLDDSWSGLFSAAARNNG